MLLIQFVEVFQVLFLTVETFHNPYTGYVLVVLSIDYGNGSPDAHEGPPGEPLPVAQHEKERWYHAHADQGQAPVNDQHHEHDTHQTQDIRHTLYNELKGLL